MKKLNIPYFVSIVSICIVLSGCGNQAQPLANVPAKDDYRLLADYLEARHHLKLNNEINQLFILTEKGCPSCNKHFSQFMTKHLKSDNTLFLINAEGNRFDISPFKSKDKNILWENPAFASSFPLLNNSKVIFFKDSKIASTIPISADGLETQFASIEQQIMQNNE